MISTKKILDETDKKIIRGYAEGKTAKEVASEFNLTSRQVEARIREMKKYYQCYSITQLVLNLKGVVG